MEVRKPESPFGKLQKRSLQFSLKSMLMIMMVVAVASTVIVAALRTPDISSEIAMWSGSWNTSTSSSRYTHLIFLLLCYCSTMMLALIVQVSNQVVRWYSKRLAKRAAAEGPEDPFGDKAE